MKVKLIQCGPYANDSERRATEFLKEKLESLSGDGLWVLFSNIEFGTTPSSRPDEIDLLVVGPSGVHVLETKHWDNKYVENKANALTVDDQSEILNKKARRIAGKVKRLWASANFIQGKFLLTKGENISYASTLSPIKGAGFYALRDWKELLDVSAKQLLTAKQTDELASSIMPSARVTLTGDIRHFGNYSNLELSSPRDDRVHRVYRGQNARTQDKVVLHIYDYSASDSNNPDLIARREFETIQRLQKSPWLPKLMESFQEAPEYPGELYFFSLVDPGAPTVLMRKVDRNWKTDDKIAFVARCFSALSDLHEPADPDNPAIIHRNLNQSTIHVRTNGNPLFTGLRLSRIAEMTSLPVQPAPQQHDSCTAPEVISGGIAAASKASDVYSMCASLKDLLAEGTGATLGKVQKLLEAGLNANSEDRPSAAMIASQIGEQIKQPTTSSITKPEALPSAQYWDEGTELDFNQSRYRVVSKLGSGGWGTTFKVVEIDKTSDEEYGTYVAKAIHTESEGNSAIRAYKKIRAHTIHNSLSMIHEIAERWRPDAFVALMRWIDGVPLASLTGEISAYADKYGESSVEELVMKWLVRVCQGLSQLHQAGYVHGDVTPKNLIVVGQDIFLTDYDLATRIGLKSISKGTLPYCSSAMQTEHELAPGDDIFSLGASFFHVLFDKLPFDFNGELRKNAGLNWDGVDCDQFLNVIEFLKLCTTPDESARLRSASEAIRFLNNRLERVDEGEFETGSAADENRTPNEVLWLTEVLKAYPKSRFGNAETRGLDSDFAKHTYVETDLERNLCQGIMKRDVKLVILTGNAGDGKTAFLQHLANSLGVPVEKSSTRIVDQTISNGLRVRINLDGSASYQGRSATELLDELFGQFHNGAVSPIAVHLVAINSGPLLAWIEDFAGRNPGKESVLISALWSAIEGNYEDLPSWLRFIDFNDRSLVGGVNRGENMISTEFVDQLVDALLGSEKADEIWSPCASCTAQPSCPIFNTVSRVRGTNSYTKENALLMRQRLYTALQAVHQRAEVHITARDLRGALSYIIFGLHNCKDIHAERMEEYLPFWDRAFSAKSPRRQGEVLMELCTLDPALESNPNLDRFLLGLEQTNEGSSSPRYPDLELSSARRRAFFEWNDEEVAKFASNGANLFGIRRSAHFQLFRRFPLLKAEEKSQICRDLCVGLSRLVDLPDVVLNQPDQVPLRITPRTPTETVLWVNKPISRFSLRCALSDQDSDMEALHTHLVLTYQYKNGFNEDLYLGADLFSILMELKEGHQFVNAALDDTFANLSIFIGRLAQEDQTELMAWNPANENKTYKLTASLQNEVRCLEIH